MQHYTVQDIMDLGPCQPTKSYPDAGYPEWRVRELFRGRQSVTLLDICDNERVPIEDRQWALHRLLPEPFVHEAACRYAEHALERERAAGREPDQRSWDAIAAKRRWLRGELSDAELEAACHAALNAARYAAWEAAWVASAAAWAATWVAARSADCAAASAADWHAERQWQLDTLRAMIVEHYDGDTK